MNVDCVTAPGVTAIVIFLCVTFKGGKDKLYKVRLGQLDHLSINIEKKRVFRKLMVSVSFMLVN